jgi:arylsulfatase A-like enzyme
MSDSNNPNRREFLERLGAGAVLGAAHGSRRRRRHPAQQSVKPAAAWTAPPTLKNPNILVIMVDQMRVPMWLSPSLSASLATTLPNIIGRLGNNSYNFSQFFVNATNCTPSRACIMTGLYTPQTGMYDTEGNASSSAGTPLDPSFPTWASAIATLNPAYAGNCWWFGKWHLSNESSSTPLADYGLNTRTYPGGPTSPYNPSPNGAANEGTDGGYFAGLNQTYANDSQITSDFLGWLQGQAPSSGAPSTPWCATVSLINPHDISQAPDWLQLPYPPPGITLPLVYFPPPQGPPPSYYTAQPSPWNYEDLDEVTSKPSWQYTYQSHVAKQVGAVSDWVLFLNQYIWLHSFVDQQVGLILDALQSSPYANNTIIVFLSDHGEFAGSHGLHGKGNAVYDEALRVPLYVQFPGQTGTISMNQMCCAVDVFGLMCDLATRGSGQWRLAYPDLANRQSIWSFLYRNSSETRIVPGQVGLPYILHTYDEAPEYAGTINSSPPKLHIVCLRTKLDLNAGAIGAKLAYYWAWDPCTNYPNATPPDGEFYDYNPSTTNNTAEMGNDFTSNNATTQQTIQQYTQALGVFRPQPSGLIASELNPPLVGVDVDHNPLSQVQQNAYLTYYNYVYGNGYCP